MPFASKSQQRLERSTGGVSADRVVTGSDAPELKKMSQNKDDLCGGRIGGKASGGGALRGGSSLGEKGSSTTLYGSMSKTGAGQKHSYTSGAGVSKTGTEKPGRTGETFQAQETRSGKTKSDGKQGSNHNPDKGKLGKNGRY